MSGQTSSLRRCLPSRTNRQASLSSRMRCFCCLTQILTSSIVLGTPSTSDSRVNCAAQWRCPFFRSRYSTKYPCLVMVIFTRRGVICISLMVLALVSHQFSQSSGCLAVSQNRPNNRLSSLGSFRPRSANTNFGLDQRWQNSEISPVGPHDDLTMAHDLIWGRFGLIGTTRRRRLSAIRTDVSRRLP